MTKVTFEQAWNIRAAGSASCTGITAAQAARGEIPEWNLAARFLASNIRWQLRNGATLRTFVSQAIYQNACTATSGKIFELKRKYEQRGLGK